MFIVHTAKQKGRKPQRGGIMGGGGGHAAPTELELIIVGLGATNMSLLRSCAAN